MFAISYILFAILRYANVFDPVFMEGIVKDAGPWGPAVIITIIAITSFSITAPSSPFMLIAGALYGPLYATIYIFIGVLIGSSAAFWIARIFRAPIVKMLGSHAELLQRFHKKYVMIVIFVTRSLPLVSFEVMSYAAGLTSISYGQYMIANLGAIAGIFFITSAGSMGANIAFSSPGQWASIGLALMVVAMLFVVPLAIDHFNPFGWKEKLLQEEKPIKPKRTT